MSKRTIAIFTGNRAEYGLQLPILRAVQEHPDLEYYLIVSGAHLDNSFGSTKDEIREDGFRIDAEVEIKMDAMSLAATAEAIGSGIISISKVLADLKPDLMVVYADRFEGFAAVIAATQTNVPTAHIEGGDLTEGGALDDSVRHAMTKLSHLHFTTNDQATKRILAMGEEAWRVHTVGFPAIDLIEDNNFASRSEIEAELGLDFSRPIVLFTQHSVTQEFDLSKEQLAPSLSAITKLADEGVQTIITYPNNDAGGRQIIDALDEYRELNIENTQIRQSLGRYMYHGVLSLAKHNDLRVACVGNSSSGLKETPAFGCPTVNLGSRQDGRLRGNNVVDAGYDVTSIYDSVKKCLFDDDFIETCHNSENPYWLGGAGPKIANILASVKIDQDLLRKKMTLKGEMRDGWFR